jgi:hypothetical protein
MADIRHMIQISAAPAAVYALVSSGPRFARWWAEDVTENGGVAELGFFNRRTVYRLRSQPGEPERRAEWVCESGDEWGGTRLVFALETNGTGTIVRFAHAGWRGETDYFVSCNTTWGELMYRLKSAAESGRRGPLFMRDGLGY